jgi:hypothetical protein
MNADGTGVTPLTGQLGDGNPDWAPARVGADLAVAPTDSPDPGQAR